MKKAVSLIIMAAMGVAAFAADQVLVFRKNGDINSFSTDKLQSIECSTVDADGNDREKPVSQIFIMDGSKVVIPIADIDSVTFGAPDAIRAKKDARRIADSELPYISGYDGKVLSYLTSAPTGVVPAVGTKIYYDAFCDVFPFGLCAEVTSMTSENGEYRLGVKDIDPREVFDEYLVTGDFDLAVPAAASLDNGKQRASADGGFPYSFNSDVIDFASKGVVTVRFENFVGSVLTGFYSADIYLGTDFEIDTNLHFSTPEQSELETKSLTLMRGVIGGVLYPRLNISGFADIAASMSLGFNLHRTSETHIKWTCRGTDHTFDIIEDADANNDPGTNEAKLDVMLEGSLHLGVKLDTRISTLFNVVGGGITAKVGPEFKGNVGYGIIEDLTKEYSYDAFNKARIEASLLGKIETYVYHLKNIAWGEEDITPLPFGGEIRLFQRTWPLLPEFDSRAVVCHTQGAPGVPAVEQPAADIASVNRSEIVSDLPVGFEIVSRADDKVLSQTFTGETVKSNTSEAQGFNTRMALDGARSTDVYVRPVVKYADRVVKCKPTDVMAGAHLSQVFTTMAGGGAYAVGGTSVAGQINAEDNTMIIGNHVPAVAIDPVFAGKRTFSMLSFIEDDGKQSGGTGNSMFGTWKGRLDDLAINMTLNADHTAVYNSEAATYTINMPQSGMICLTFADGRRLIVSIVEIGASELKIKFKNSDKIVTLTK